MNKRKSKINNLTGMEFGWIKVIKKVGENDKKQYLYLCKCQCGNEFIRASSDIRRLTCCYNCRNKKRSLDKNKLEIGKKYGLLTIINIYFINNEPNLKCWAICECGEEGEYSLTSILNGHTKSCGCLNKGLKEYRLSKGIKIGGNFLPSGEADFNHTYNSYIKRAKRDGIEFCLSKELFSDVTSLSCYYCGKPPRNYITNVFRNGFYAHNGIDRLDNSKGYVLGNIVPCCSDCNFMKHIRSEQEFLLWVKKIHNYQKEKNV